MNYYDEEISLEASEPNSLNNSNQKHSRTEQGSKKAHGRNSYHSGRTSGFKSRNPKDNNRILNETSADDDGLLQNILDRDEDNDDNEDDDDDDSFDISEAQQTPLSLNPSISRQKPLLEKLIQEDTNEEIFVDEESDDEHDEATGAKQTRSGRSDINAITDLHFKIMPEKWESLKLPREIKNLLQYICKYTPQNLEIPYQLRPFIPDYVPAVGDVDAFLKVSVPPLFKPDRQEEIHEHISRLGLHCLDEPSGEQTDPSLLYIKLRSTLSASGASQHSASSHVVPIAKSSKDIDKWIAEVEQLHITHSVFDAQPNKDMEALMINWPRSFANAKNDLQDAYQRAIEGDLDLIGYVRLLCQKFEVDGRFETQMDYVNHVHSLFALYLAANQAWE